MDALTLSLRFRAAIGTGDSFPYEGYGKFRYEKLAVSRFSATSTKQVAFSLVQLMKGDCHAEIAKAAGTSTEALQSEERAPPVLRKAPAIVCRNEVFFI
jgi:hypothetical protein